MSKPQAMPFAVCWQRLLQSIIQPILDILNAPNIQKPLPRLSIVNYSATANTNIMSTDTSQGLKAVNAPCIFRIYVVLGTAGIFSIIRTAGNASNTEKMNGAVALTAAAGYMFDVLVDQGEYIDFQTSVTGIVVKLSVVEKDDAK
jgi:hypothetical protein